LTNWIESEVKKRGSKIETKALKMLAEYVGSDLWRMNMEIEKLIAYSAARGNNIITENDVNLLVNEKGEENIFALIDALGAKNKKLILKLLEDQIKSGVNELYILKMLVRQFRILLQIKEMIEKDLFFLKKDSALKWRISKDLGIHPFAVSKALDQIKNFSFEELKTIYNSLLEIEVKIKSSNVSPLLLFEIFVAKIC
jgi:DNA polymerase-3 subunit delta